LSCDDDDHDDDDYENDDIDCIDEDYKQPVVSQSVIIMASMTARMSLKLL